MTQAEQYRVLAADCEGKARNERVPQLRAEWNALAKSYRRLAEQADRNRLNDITYEPPLRFDNGNGDPGNSPPD
jgi:hypothetical protein